MRTRSQSRNSNRQQLQVNLTFVEPFNLVEPIPVVTMDDTRTMAQLLEAPTVGYEDAIVVPEITADNFELKHDQFEKEPPRSIITWDDLVLKFFNKFFHPSKTTNLRNEIMRSQQRFDETFYEAWDRFNDLLRACPHHGFSELHQLDSFYNALNSNDQDSLNSAAGGNFLDKMPHDCLRIIESKSKVRNSRNKPVVTKVSSSSSTPDISPDVAELKDMVKALLLERKTKPKLSPPSKRSRKVVGILWCSGTLPSNTITNPKVDLKGITTQSGVAYQGPTIPITSSPPKVMECETEVTKDTVHPTNNRSTKDVQPPVVQVQSQVPNSEPVVDLVSALMHNCETINSHILQDEILKKFLVSQCGIAMAIPTPYYDHIDKPLPPPLTPIGIVIFFIDKSKLYLCSEDDPTSPEVDDSDYDSEGDILLLESFLNDDASPPPNQGNYLPEIRKELKICEAKTDKSSIDEPPEVELKDLPPHLEYAFLEGDN
ncbi:reverse transcriptase domain-containing protein [Tanacetum coccineum]